MLILVLGIGFFVSDSCMDFWLRIDVLIVYFFVSNYGKVIVVDVWEIDIGLDKFVFG